MVAAGDRIQGKNAYFKSVAITIVRRNNDICVPV